MGITVYLSRQAGGFCPAREELIDKIITTYHQTPFFRRPKIFIITPQQNTYQIERELIEKIGQGGLFGINILDLESLYQRIINESGQNLELVDEHGRLMLMQRTLNQVQDELSAYRSSSSKVGFAEQVIEQIGELKESQITSEMLEENKDAFKGSLLSDKMHDLSLLYSTFTENLGPDRIDEDDQKALALSLLPTSELLKDAYLFFIDMNFINNFQTRFIVEAGKVAHSIDIALVSDNDRTVADISAFNLVNHSIDLLTVYSRQENVPLKLIDLPLKETNSPFSIISNQLFSYAPKLSECINDQVFVLKEKDPWEEVTRIAQLIIQENQKGTPFSKIVVAVPELELYETIIRRVFSLYQIPIFVDENHQVTENHFIQSLLFALDSVISGFNRNDMIAYFKSDFSGLTAQEADELENYVIEAGIRPWEWNKPFTRVPKTYGLEEKQLPDEHPINQAREKIIKRLGLLKDQKNNFSFFKDNLIAFLEAAHSQEILEDLSEELSLQGEQELASRYRQIWNILIDILNQMERALGQEKTDLKEFAQVLKAGLSTYEVGVIPEDTDAVIIADLSRSRLPDIDSLYFLGVNEENIPKSYSDQGLFSEMERQKLSEIFNLKANQLRGLSYYHQLENVALYQFLTKPRKKLVLSFSVFNQEGDPLLPSRFITTLDYLFGPTLELRRDPLFSLLTPKRSGAILDALDPNIKNYDQIVKIIQEWIRENRDSLETPFIPDEDIKIQADYTLREEKPIDIYKRESEPLRVSVSSLESYANCAFRYFLDYGLRPTQREEYEVRALDTGIIVHEIFDQFLSKLKDRSATEEEYFKSVQELIENKDKFEEEANSLYKVVFENVDDAKRYEHTAASRYLIKKIKRIILISLYVILNQIAISGFMPETLEDRFIDDSEQSLIVNGRIDRVDVQEDEDDKKIVRVIDYKTGSKELTYTDLFYGRALQLALYLYETIEKIQLTTDKEVVPGGAYYFTTDYSDKDLEGIDPDDLENKLFETFRLQGLYGETEMNHPEVYKQERAKLKPTKLSKDEFTKILSYAKDKVDSLSERILQGDISIQPVCEDDTVIGCNFCTYREICRFDPNSQEAEVTEIKKLDKDLFFAYLNEEMENG